MSYTVFPLISAGPQISAAPLGFHTEISASPLMGASPPNTGHLTVEKFNKRWRLLLEEYGISITSFRCVASIALTIKTPEGRQ